MKKIIITTILVFVLVSCSTIPRFYDPISQNKDEVLYSGFDKKLMKEYVRHKVFFSQNKPINIFYEDGQLIGQFTVEASSWIHPTLIVFKASNGTTVELDVKYSERFTSLKGSELIEYVLLPISDNEREKLHNLLSTPDTFDIVFIGTWEKSFSIPSEQTSAAFDILSYTVENF